MNYLCAKWTLVSTRGALFLDRDGVVIQDKGYVNTIDQSVFIPETIEAIKIAKNSGFLVFIVTNQAGVARQLYSEIECRDYNLWLLRELAREGAVVDELVYCPSHPEFTDQPSICICRKPDTGMLDYLVTKWHLDKENSLMIGDNQTDYAAGTKVGISAILISQPSDILNTVVEFVANHVSSGCFDINSNS
jgi:D-glycero-D-manno-heptose 1,7-bisphosphate phosphatase